MAIITISRGSYSYGKEVAEKVAARLNYECVSRDILLEASDRFNIPELKLARAIHDAPSLLDRFTHGRQSYIAYIQSALTHRVRGDNVVYHGLAGHILLRGVTHVVKIRIIADLTDRVAAEMKRRQMSEKEARASLLRDDRERKKWSNTLYGVDPTDPSLYDLLIRVHALKVEDAVDFICDAASREPFKTTAESQRAMDDLALACQIKATIIESFPDIAVSCSFGNVLIYTKSKELKAHKIEQRAQPLKDEIPGIHNLEVHTVGHFPLHAV